MYRVESRNFKKRNALNMLIQNQVSQNYHLLLEKWLQNPNNKT